jgi:S-adenosylmethionine:diacylglycerol 3-amino-3-carboxypropyl transferase
VSYFVKIFPTPTDEQGGKIVAKNDSGEIPRRALGRTGAQVSALALGGYHLGMAKTKRAAARIVRINKNVCRVTVVEYDTERRALEDHPVGARYRSLFGKVEWCSSGFADYISKLPS